MDGLVGMGTGMELFGMGFRSVVTVSMLWRYGDIGVVPRWSVCRDIIPSASCLVWRRGRMLPSIRHVPFLLLVRPSFCIYKSAGRQALLTENAALAKPP